MSQDKDNNEAASAPDLRAVLIEVQNALKLANEIRDGGPICDTIWMPERCETLFDFIEAALEAASASQSSTPVPRVGGPDEAKAESSDLAHVARQRQESPSSAAVDAALKDAVIHGTGMHIAKPDGSAEHVSPEKFRAAVAEGVDTALPEPVFTHESIHTRQKSFYYSADQMREHGAQQREAGRQEMAEKVAMLERTLAVAQTALESRNAMDAILARQPVSEEPIDFVQALAIAQSVFDRYKEDQPKWWAKMDGTPILNDIAVRMAEAFRDEADSAAPPAKAEGMSDTERLDFITTFGEPWAVQWEKRGAKPVRYRMIDDGEPWGKWHASAREAIDAAILTQQAKGESK